MNDNFKENRLRGSAAFPFALYETERDIKPFKTEFHWQDDVEVLYVKNGSVNLTLGGTQMLLHEGDIVWINAGQLHQFSEIGTDTNCEIFIFPTNQLLFEKEDHDQQKLVRPLVEGKLGFPMRLPENSEADGLIHEIFELQKQRPIAYEVMTKALLLQLIALIARADGFVSLTPPESADICKQILTYIHMHYSEKLSVSDVASAVGISPTYFSAFFAKRFFRNFQEYLVSYRIEQACTLLTGTTLSVTEIAMETGFSSSSQFIHSFKQTKGTTPLKYRKQALKVG